VKHEQLFLEDEIEIEQPPKPARVIPPFKAGDPFWWAAASLVGMAATFVFILALARG
jgi:hypothetical protein